MLNDTLLLLLHNFFVLYIQPDSSKQLFGERHILLRTQVDRGA